MTCRSQIFTRPSGGFTPCYAPAVTKVFCPTWITAIDGPMPVCSEHIKTFMPEHNKYAKDEAFYFGQDADNAFALFGASCAGEAGWKSFVAQRVPRHR